MYRPDHHAAPKTPYVASADQIRITRQGDYAIFEYADDKVAVTHLRLGADVIASMTDEELLDYWNDFIEEREADRRAIAYTATEIPVGKPQLEYSERADQWVPRGHVVRCQILSDCSQPNVDEPFICIDGRDFTASEFMKMVGTFGSWGMRIEFVPNDELDRRPRLKVREPDPKKGSRCFSRRRA